VIDPTNHDPTNHDPGDEDRRHGPPYCRNCGDPLDAGAADAAAGKPPSTWRPCPNPSPGRPLYECGVGGHMYDAADSYAGSITDLP
jgi:hypothetical protein